MKILVTGGAGFIGSHIVENFQEKAEVCVPDVGTLGDPWAAETFGNFFNYIENNFPVRHHGIN